MVVLSQWWLTLWSARSLGDNVWLYVDVYAALMLASTALVVVRALVAILSCIRAGRTMHEEAAKAVVGSPLSFFDTTPLGRIINRFSNDQEVVDEQIQWSLSYFLWNCFELVGCVVQLALNSLWSLVGLVPLFAVYYVIARFYRHSSRELQRLNSVSTSPIYAAFEEALVGEAHIRTYGAAIT